jgi:hypothetical protein
MYLAIMGNYFGVQELKFDQIRFCPKICPKQFHKIGSSGQCYDHNFLRFLPIFGEKIGVFLKNQCYDPIFA